MEILTKICSKCKTEKLTTEFNKQKDKKDGLTCNCKSCIKEYRNKNKEYFKNKKREHYLKNKDIIIAKVKEYSNINKNKIQEYKAKRYYENIEILKEKSKEYRENNKNEINKNRRLNYSKNIDKHKLKNKLNYEKHKTDRLLKMKEYAKTDKGKLIRKNISHKRRLNISCNSITTEDLDTLYKNTKNCYWCDCKLEKGNIHLDHYIPISKGGLHTISNLVLACSKCNLQKGSKDPFIFAQQKGKLL